MSELPLAGIRVLDLSWITAGPTATRLLAAMGAEVIKVGSARRPDPSTRGLPIPPVWRPRAGAGAPRRESLR